MNLIVLCLFPARPTQDSFQPGLQSQASTLHGGGQPRDAPSQPVDPSPSPQAPFPWEPSWPCEGASVPLQVHPVCALHPWAPAPDLWWGPWQEVLAGDGQVGQREGLRHLPSRPLPPESCGSPRSGPLLPEAPRPPSQQQHGRVGWPLAFVAPPAVWRLPRAGSCCASFRGTPHPYSGTARSRPCRRGEGKGGVEEAVR